MIRPSGQTMVDIKSNDYKKIIKSYLGINMVTIPFFIGNVAQLVTNGRYIYLWQDAKGQVCYCFDIYDREYFTTSATKLGNVLSQHFQCEIEVVNNEKEHLKKMVNAQGQLNRAITDSERYYTFNSYNGDLSYSSNDLSYSKRNLNTSSIKIGRAHV